MATESLDERYFLWLYSQVASPNTRARVRLYKKLLGQLHEKEFVWLVANDDNRVEDGRALRDEFAEEHGVQGSEQWHADPCTMLELFLVLARSLAFQMDDEVDIWFWHLVEVLGLKRYNDLEYDTLASEIIDEALDNVIWRRYEPNGVGGLFPLRHAEEDQREVELWYQLNAYLLEQF